ncbi:MarR family transcriptional regulator (plasmid) [Diaphorobacter sp. HDW4B]|uniref:MarR family winged helix-turn-helix transcriptional regulator n=1 Tax=Diaphorobacter sp. HDW4B TaxID=2714925 RepID=UPI00140CD848|nr:MarR family transcriptional regulator [Diaphorobacter sp. HDW4B]QIL73985.1 MarR family transcriptional regulator [Diaphorobacter sp. HDW4B]
MATSKNTAASAAKAAKTSPSTATPAAVQRVTEDNWDQRLGFLMHDVSRLRRTVFDDFMRPLNITRSQWWVLAYLSRHDGMIQSDLASVLELGKAALGSLIDRLEAAGLVRRGADETDRRAKRVYLSAAGASLIKEMRVLSNDMSERILDGLDDDTRHELADLLGRVKDNLLAISKGKA